MNENLDELFLYTKRAAREFGYKINGIEAFVLAEWATFKKEEARPLAWLVLGLGGNGRRAARRLERLGLVEDVDVHNEIGNSRLYMLTTSGCALGESISKFIGLREIAA